MNEIKLTVKQFSLYCGKSAQFINTYCKRGKIEKINGLISLDSPINKLYIQNLQAKGESFNLLAANISTKKNKIEDNKNTSTQLTDLQELEVKKRVAEIRRLDSVIELNEIKIKKQNGILIPFEAVKFIFIRGIASFEAQFKNIIESVLIIAQNSNIDYHTKLKEIHHEINLSKDEAQSDLLKEVDNLVKEYSETFEVGQKKT